jgi:PLP dependent protein
MSSAEQRRERILQGIAAAAKLARRKSDEITLVAVSKTRTAGEIEPLVEAGQRDFGESRIQEAQAKWPPILARHSDLRLHCIGRLQSNKAGDAVKLFDTIHSLDRESLLEALVKEGEKAGRFPSVHVQVNIGDEPQKGGCAIGEVGSLVAAVRDSPLPLAGLMCIPPLGLEPSPFFALLAKLAREHGVAGLSMGMSADFRAAVMLGASAVRVGRRCSSPRECDRSWPLGGEIIGIVRVCRHGCARPVRRPGFRHRPGLSPSRDCW